MLDDGRTVVNVTLPGHILHDGMVERRAVQQSDGSWKVETQGIGNNETPGMNILNTLAGPEVFDALDDRLRQKYWGSSWKEGARRSWAFSLLPRWQPARHGCWRPE